MVPEGPAVDHQANGRIGMAAEHISEVGRALDRTAAGLLRQLEELRVVRARVVKFGRIVDGLEVDARLRHELVSVECGHVESELVQRGRGVRQELCRLGSGQGAVVGEVAGLRGESMGCGVQGARLGLVGAAVDGRRGGSCSSRLILSS